MAFEPIYDVVAADNFQSLGVGQTTVEAKLVPHNGELTKILGVFAVPFSVVATEVFSGEARIKGKVEFLVLYLGSDGEHCLSYTADFSDKIVNDEITGGATYVISKVIDTRTISVRSGEIRLAAVVQNEIFGASGKRIKYLVSGGDGVYSHEGKVGYDKVIASVNGSIPITVSAPSAQAYESRVLISKTTAVADVVIVEGELFTDALSEDHISTPFSFEIEAVGASHGDNVCLTAQPTDVRISQAEEGVLLDYSVGVSGLVLRQSDFCPITDVFSVSNELVKETETVKLTMMRGCNRFVEDVSGNISLDASMPIADNITNLFGSSVIIAGAYPGNGKISIEGIARLQVVYFSGESNSMNSVEGIIPFSITHQLDVNESDSIIATAEVVNITAKLRRGNEIDIRATLGFCVQASTVTESTVITSLGLGDKIPLRDGAISLHIASKKETLWDVSKAFGVEPEEILRQNPNIGTSLSGGERIIIYRKLDK